MQRQKQSVPCFLRGVLCESGDGREDPVSEIFTSRKKAGHTNLLHQVDQVLGGAFSHHCIQVTIGGVETNSDKSFRKRRQKYKLLLN